MPAPICPAQQDLHTPQVLAALQCLSTASLQLQSVPGLQQQLISQTTGHSCHGQLTFSSRRAKLGRLRVDQQLYRLLPSGGVTCFAAPQGVALDARTLVQSALNVRQLQQLQAGKQGSKQDASAAAAPAAGGGAGAGGEGDSEGQLAKKMSSSMRLEVSEQVRLQGKGGLHAVFWGLLGWTERQAPVWLKLHLNTGHSLVSRFIA